MSRVFLSAGRHALRTAIGLVALHSSGCGHAEIDASKVATAQPVAKPNAAPIPVWQDINRRYQPAEVFGKMLALAGKEWPAVEEVENTFGIKLKFSRESKFVGKQYIAEGERGDAFTFSVNEKTGQWWLVLVGFSVGVPKDYCVKYKDALHSILIRDWIEKTSGGHSVYYYYSKTSDRINRAIQLGDYYNMEADSCLNSFHVSVSNRTK
jgi:hypothetical protein